MGFEGWGYTVHISDIHKVLKLSCLINDWKNRGACPQVSVFLGRDGRLTVRVRPGSYKLYLISKYLLDDRKYFAALFRELDKEGEYECENCQDGKAHIHNDGGFLLESRKRCPAMAAFEKSIDPKPRQGPASPAVVHEMESYKKSIDYSSIEKDMVPLVSAINSVKGICTMYSCEGHRYSLLSIPHMPPFVKFHGGFPRVRDLAEKIYGLHLNYEWIIVGQVINECPNGTPHIFWTLTLRRPWYLRSGLRRDILEICRAILEDTHGCAGRH